MLQKIDKDRLDKVLKLLEESNIRFPIAETVNRTGYKKGHVSNILSGKIPISDNFYDTFMKKFLPETLHEPEQSYLLNRRNKKNNETKPGIPIYEAAPTTLTITEVYRDEKKTDPDFWVTIPFLRDCDYGCRAKGDSMHPLIRTNALIIGKRIHDFNVIIFGEIYTIKTKNNIETTKYIHPHPENNEMVLLVPYNDKAKTTPIYKTDILELYEAKAVFNNL